MVYRPYLFGSDFLRFPKNESAIKNKGKATGNDIY